MLYLLILNTEYLYVCNIAAHLQQEENMESYREALQSHIVVRERESGDIFVEAENLRNS